jgi:hypothetical protein
MSGLYLLWSFRVRETLRKSEDSMSNLTPPRMQPGYYRDYDSWLYLTSTGELYCVSDPDSPEPVWRSIGLPLPDDAKLRVPDDEDVAAFERTRIAYNIPQ